MDTNATMAIKLPLINTIIGHTEINHKIRIFLNLSCEEYCLVDLIEKCHAKKVEFTYQECYRRIGIEKQRIDELISTLRKYKIIEIVKDEYITGSLWRNQFEVSQEEFNAFWEKVIFPNGRKISWTGSKTDAFNKYKMARKKYEGTYLYKKKTDYFNLLFENPERPIMMASVFLNLQTERFTEDFASQLKRTKKDINKQKIDKEGLFL
jgi:hypothetical protein